MQKDEMKTDCAIMAVKRPASTPNMSRQKIMVEMPSTMPGMRIGETISV